MPESTELKDLAEKPEQIIAPPEGKAPKPYYYTLPISVEQLPELEDYNLGEDVHLEIICRVTRVEKTENKPKNVTLEMRKGRVLNLTEKRQKALRMGVKKETLEKIEGEEQE